MSNVGDLLVQYRIRYFRALMYEDLWRPRWESEGSILNWSKDPCLQVYPKEFSYPWTKFFPFPRFSRMSGLMSAVKTGIGNQGGSGKSPRYSTFTVDVHRRQAIHKTLNMLDIKSFNASCADG